MHEGCTSSAAANFDPRASVDDGSCRPVRVGCTIDVAVNFDSAANRLDDSCEFILLGCTESAASNYERRATWDDGSCVPDVRECSPARLEFRLCGDNKLGLPICAVRAPPRRGSAGWLHGPGGFEFRVACKRVPSRSVPLRCDRLHGSVVRQLLAGGHARRWSCRARHPGCLSPLAANYDSDANIDMPASCVFPDAGCTVESALNFEPDATRDDGSCLFGRAGCDDSRALKCAAALPAAQKANPCPAAALPAPRSPCSSCLPARPRCLPSSPVAGTAFVRRGRRKHSAPVPVVGALLLSYSTSAHLHRSFDPNATVARGCVFAGCADSRALNADAEADVDDGSCVYAHASCSDSSAANFARGRICRYGGCLEARAQNFDPSADFDDGSCAVAAGVLGCTDSAAEDYDSLATIAGPCARGGVRTRCCPATTHAPRTPMEAAPLRSGAARAPTRSISSRSPPQTTGPASACPPMLQAPGPQAPSAAAQRTRAPARVQAARTVIALEYDPRHVRRRKLRRGHPRLPGLSRRKLPIRGH